MKEYYSGIDIAKFIFACLIPLLHIPFMSTSIKLHIFQQYLARLGVPFFFAVTGFFLIKSIERRGAREALLHYSRRIGKLLLFWLMIYSPILYFSMSDVSLLVQELLFKTPAYLWYLSATLFAAFPFCCVRNRKLLWAISIGLYIFGTLISESYTWLTGGMPAYTAIFLTPRNGLHFALPMMCVGEIVRHKTHTSLKQLPALLLAGIALFAEITFVGNNASAGADRSMYISLPVFTFYLLCVVIKVRTPFNTRFLNGASVAIYVMQFGIITVLGIVLHTLGFSSTLQPWVIYLGVISGGCIGYWVCRKNKLLMHLV